jgi:mannosyltransferase OCH1-like enzyme
LFKTGPYKEPPEYLIDIFNINKSKLNVNKVIYFNDENCDIFMKSMGIKYYKAYNMLIPNAYRADLWRYCILYKYGGIYGDLTQTFLVDYDVNKNNVDMVFVKDGLKNDIQISFMATIKNNNFFKYVIDNVTTNILKKNKGENLFDITGPRACARNLFNFFSIKEIPLGFNKLKGLDNKYYNIRIDMQQAPKSFIDIYTNKKMVITKIKDHDNIITTEGKQPKYNKLYKDGKVFRE